MDRYLNEDKYADTELKEFVTSCPPHWTLNLSLPHSAYFNVEEAFRPLDLWLLGLKRAAWFSKFAQNTLAKTCQSTLIVTWASLFSC